MKNTTSNKPITTDLKGGDSASSRSEALEAFPLEVKVYEGNFEQAMKRFRNMVQKERVIATYKEKQRYEKPSEKKRRKRAENQRKRLELLRGDDYIGSKRKKSPKPKSKDTEKAESQ